MLGAIAGDIIGSAWGASGEKRFDFPLFSARSRFTDDTVMTVAIAHALLDERDYAATMRDYGRRYPFVGYHAHFHRWLSDPGIGPYGGYDSGAATRASPVGFAAVSADDALAEAERSALPTHNHPEGIRGAQAIALAIYLARSGEEKEAIRRELIARFGYSLDRTVEETRPGYRRQRAAERSVPEAIISFLDAEDFESAVRNAVSMGGDADTMACIAGAIAEAYFGGVPDAIAAEVHHRLPPDLLLITERFDRRWGLAGE